MSNPKSGKSIVPWFLKSDNSQYDIKRYNDYVINETAAHYGVVEKIVQSSWRDAGILVRSLLKNIPYNSSIGNINSTSQRLPFRHPVV